MEKSLGTLGSTGGAGRLGGAFATPGAVGGLLVAGNFLHIKQHATDYSATTTSANVANGRITTPAGAIGTPVSIRGYETTPFDDTGVRPVYKWGVNAGTNPLLNYGGQYQDLENIILDGDGSTYTSTRAINHAANCRCRRVKFMRFNNSQVLAFGNQSTFWDCEVASNTVSFTTTNNPYRFDHCYFHDNTTDVISCNSATFHSCIFDSNGGHGVTSGTALMDFNNCVFYNNTGAGVNLTGAPTWIRFTNCIFVNNSTYGVALAAAYENVFFDNCAFYNNTSGKYQTANVNTANIRGEIILTEDPFVDAANGDFRLNMKAGGGALLRGAGYPSTFPGLTYAHRRDIGAHQHSGPSAGMSGGFIG